MCTVKSFLVMGSTQFSIPCVVMAEKRGGGMFLFRARTKTGEDNARLGKKSNNIKIFKSVKDTNAW